MKPPRPRHRYVLPSLRLVELDALLTHPPATGGLVERESRSVRLNLATPLPPLLFPPGSGGWVGMSVHLAPSECAP